MENRKSHKKPNINTFLTSAIICAIPAFAAPALADNFCPGVSDGSKAGVLAACRNPSLIGAPGGPTIGAGVDAITASFSPNSNLEENLATMCCYLLIPRVPGLNDPTTSDVADRRAPFVSDDVTIEVHALREFYPASGYDESAIGGEAADASGTYVGDTNQKFQGKRAPGENIANAGTIDIDGDGQPDRTWFTRSIKPELGWIDPQGNGGEGALTNPDRFSVKRTQIVGVADDGFVLENIEHVQLESTKEAGEIGAAWTFANKSLRFTFDENHKINGIKAFQDSLLPAMAHCQNKQGPCNLKKAARKSRKADKNN